MRLALPLWVCVLGACSVACQQQQQQGRVSLVSQLTKLARTVANSPQLGDAVELTLSRTLGVPRPRLAGIAASLQNLFGNFPLGNPQELFTAAIPAMAVTALVLSIIALVKTAILFKSSDLSLFDIAISALGFGKKGDDYATGAEHDDYGHYDPTEYVYHVSEPTEYVHHVPKPLEYGHISEHVLHHDGGAFHHSIVSDVSGYSRYAGRRALDGLTTDRKSRNRSSPGSPAADKDMKPKKNANIGQAYIS